MNGLHAILSFLSLDDIRSVLGLIVIGFLLWIVFQPKKGMSPAEAQNRNLCVECGYDLRETPKRCPECGAVVYDRVEYLRSIREDWPDNPIRPRKPDLGEQLHLLVSTASHQEAQWLSEQLIARGIACLIQKENLNEVRGPYAVTTQFLRVLVYAQDLEYAKMYLWRARGIPAELVQERGPAIKVQ